MLALARFAGNSALFGGKKVEVWPLFKNALLLHLRTLWAIRPDWVQDKVETVMRKKAKQIALDKKNKQSPLIHLGTHKETGEKRKQPHTKKQRSKQKLHKIAPSHTI